MKETHEYICLADGCLEMFKVTLDPTIDDVHECPKCGAENPLRIDDLDGSGSF